jgi:membrane protease YdiL (CAAX protease family)
MTQTPSEKMPGGSQHHPGKDAPEPIGWLASLAWFGVPGILMALGFYLLMPWLVQRGMNTYFAYLAALGLPLLILLAASIAAFHLEGNPWDWGHFRRRFRLFKMGWKDWVWLVSLFLLAVGFNAFLGALDRWLIARGLMPVPGNLPALIDPRGTPFSRESLEAVTGGLAGNWPVFWGSLLLLVINVIGEEFWWRGVILPRQESAFYNRTWLVHGLMWTLFHFYKWWSLISLLPMSLGLSYLVTRRKNNTPGIIWHFISNGVGLLPILMGILNR